LKFFHKNVIILKIIFLNRNPIKIYLIVKLFLQTTSDQILKQRNQQNLII